MSYKQVFKHKYFTLQWSFKAPNSVFFFSKNKLKNTQIGCYLWQIVGKYAQFVYLCHFFSIKWQSNKLWSYKENHLDISKEKYMLTYHLGCFYGTFGCLKRYTFCVVIKYLWKLEMCLVSFINSLSRSERPWNIPVCHHQCHS